MTTPTTADDDHFVALARYWEKKFDLLLIERDALAQQVEALTIRDQLADHRVATAVKLAHEDADEMTRQVEALTAERDKLARDKASDSIAYKAIRYERDQWQASAQTAREEADRLSVERDALKVDAERYQLLAAYLVGPGTVFDDKIVACNTVDQVSVVVGAMKAAS